MLGYMPAIAKEIISNRFTNIHFLIGDFNVVVYNSIQSVGWVKTGTGSAIFSLEDVYINEEIKIIKENGVIVMHNTIGCNIEKDAYNLFTLDTDSGAMDVYKGALSSKVLTFNNIDSEIKTKNEYGDWYTFKLIYKQISSLENELIVGCSKDNGKTWFPFIKNRYLRK